MAEPKQNRIFLDSTILQLRPADTPKLILAATNIASRFKGHDVYIHSVPGRAGDYAAITSTTDLTPSALSFIGILPQGRTPIVETLYQRS
jgi:hypothetical protein